MRRILILGAAVWALLGLAPVPHAWAQIHPPGMAGPGCGLPGGWCTPWAPAPLFVAPATPFVAPATLFVAAPPIAPSWFPGAPYAVPAPLVALTTWNAAWAPYAAPTAPYGALWGPPPFQPTSSGACGC